MGNMLIIIQEKQTKIPNMKSPIDLVSCDMSAERTERHQKTLTKLTLKHIQGDFFDWSYLKC